VTTRLTPNFTYEEAIHSQAAVRLGLENTPDKVILNNILETARRMERVRELLANRAILVSSWYRSSEVNRTVGGSRTSSHITGEAVDFICPSFGSPYQICLQLQKHKKELWYDQLIFEGTWVHISFCVAVPTRNPRHDDLTFMLSKTYVNGFIESRK